MAEKPPAVLFMEALLAYIVDATGDTEIPAIVTEWCAERRVASANWPTETRELYDAAMAWAETWKGYA